jgi:hypothetical protein
VTISTLIQCLQEDPNPPIGYTWHKNILIYKDCLVLSPSLELKLRLLNEFHSSAIVGNLGFQKTYDHTHHSFFWVGMKKDILHFIIEYEVCQCNKGEIIKYLGSLQLLPIPPLMWMDISMEFIVGLPKYGNKSIIMVVIDRLSKYAHFCALPHPFTLTIVEIFFLDHIFNLHGIPTSIISYHDPNCTSTFWQEMFKLQGTQLNMSIAYHPHSNSQTKMVRQYLQTHLRCFSSDKQHQWVQWLPLFEWWYNTSYHTNTKMTPYEAMFVQRSPTITTYLLGTSKVQ